MSDEINALIDELKNTKHLGSFINTSASAPTEQPIVNEENINEYIMKTASKVIQQGVDTMEKVKDVVSRGGTPEEVESYSKLISAVTSSIDVLNKINIQNKKDKASKEIKQLEMEGKKMIEQNKKPSNTNILIATREEIMKQLLHQADEKAKTIELQPEEVDVR